MLYYSIILASFMFSTLFFVKEFSSSSDPQFLVTDDRINIPLTESEKLENFMKSHKFLRETANNVVNN